MGPQHLHLHLTRHHESCARPCPAVQPGHRHTKVQAAEDRRELRGAEGRLLLDEITKCAGEIQQAVDDCSHVTDVDSIVTCVNDILGASDCKKCVCDVLPFLCGFFKN